MTTTASGPRLRLGTVEGQRADGEDRLLAGVRVDAQQVLGGHHLAAQGAGVGRSLALDDVPSGRKMPWSSGLASRPAHDAAPIMRLGTRGCASSRRPTPSTTADAVGHHVHHGVEQLGPRGGSGLGLERRVRAARRARRRPARGSARARSVTSDVDLHDDRPRGQVLDRAERARGPAWVQSTRHGARRSSSRRRRRRGRTGSRARSRRRSSRRRSGSCVRPVPNRTTPAPGTGRRRHELAMLPVRRGSGVRIAAQPRRACARKIAVSTASTEATTTKVLQALRTTQPIAVLPGHGCRCRPHAPAVRRTGAEEPRPPPRRCRDRSRSRGWRAPGQTAPERRLPSSRAS